MTTQPPRSNGSSRGPSPAVYSVPRRYDLATLFAVTLAYAVLFAVMRLLRASPAAMVIIGGFIALVGLGQALLFKGSAPRAASMVVGMVVYGVVVPIIVTLNGPSPRIHGIRDIPAIVLAVSCWAMQGALLGYITGAAIASVFLIADVIRRRLRQLKKT
jgi:hypothetical protein